MPEVREGLAATRRPVDEASRAVHEEPREEPGGGDQQEEREDLPESDRASDLAAERRRHDPVQLGDREVLEGHWDLAERLRRDEPDRGALGRPRPDEEHVEGLVPAMDRTGTLVVGPEPVVHAAERGAAELLEVAREALVDDGFQLPRDLLARRLRAFRPLEILGRRRPVLPGGSPHESEKRAVRRLALVGVAGRLGRGRRRRRGEPGNLRRERAGGEERGAQGESGESWSVRKCHAEGQPTAPRRASMAAAPSRSFSPRGRPARARRGASRST